MKRYIFNYNCDPNLPKWCEEDILNNKYIKTELFDNLYNIYYIDDIPDNHLETIELENDILLCLISTTNSAHSISEVMDFINYYNKNINNFTSIAISINVQKKIPLIYEFITIFIPIDKITILEDKQIYKINKLTTYRNIHMNCLNNWDKVPFIKENDVLYFNNLENIRNDFNIDSIYFFDKITQIYHENKEKYQLYENIMFIKTNDDKYVFSRNRSIDKMDDDVIEIINNKNIKILSINDIKNIYEYICIFYHAKNIIVSYGGVACTNRFFCNKDVNIVLIANLHYQSEYEYDNANQLYWHVRHSHIFIAKTQKVLLDYENNINKNNINKILESCIF